MKQIKEYYLGQYKDDGLFSQITLTRVLNIVYPTIRIEQSRENKHIKSLPKAILIKLPIKIILQSFDRYLLRVK